MKREWYVRLFVIFALCIATVLGVSAQDEGLDDGPPEGDRPVAGRQHEPRINLLRQLGLSREQIQRIRRLNADRRPLVASAQERFREANRLLDVAIYADEINEEDVRARLKDVQMAHAELIRIRSMNELAVRRILTAEQLVRFRQMRARFDRQDPRNDRPMQRPGAGNGPMLPRGLKTGARPAEKGGRP